MSDVVWCDPGGHLMSAQDPEREFYSPNNQDPYHTDQRTKRIDVCGKHKQQTIEFPTLPGMKDLETRIQELEAPKTKAETAKAKGYDPEYVAWLEAQADKPIPE